MSDIRTLLRAIIIFVTIFLVSTPGYGQPEFCWKDSYGRGVGTIPGRVADCPPSYTNNGLTCGRSADSIYAPSKVADCPSGYTNMGLTCFRPVSTYSKACSFPPFVKYDCRDGYTDWGCFCAAGGSSLGPSAFVCPAGYHKSDITQRCIKDCPSGYMNTGETCFRGVSTISMSEFRCGPGEEKRGAFGRCFPIGRSCAADEEEDAGLCYQKCKPGYSGVGPVCWGDKPNGWVNCGMGAAKDDATCASAVFGQVSSVGQLALTVATAGGSAGVTAAASSAEKAGRLAKLKEKFKHMKDAYEAAKKATPALLKAEEVWQKSAVVRKAASDGKKIYNAAEADPATEEDIARISAQIASIVDSTGVSSAVAAYTYPKCSKYFPTGEPPPPANTANTGYELFFDRKLVSGPDAKHYTIGQANDNCSWNRQAHPTINVGCKFNGQVMPVRRVTAPKPIADTRQFVIKIASEGADKCLIFSGNGNDKSPSRHDWGARNEFCGFPGGKTALMANKQAVWRMAQLGGNAYMLKNSSDGAEKCLVFGGNGNDKSPSRHDWGARNEFCGFPGGKAALLANRQAVWHLVALEGNNYILKNGSDGADKCLIFSGNGKDANPSRHDWGGKNEFCGFPGGKAALLANKQAIWHVFQLN